MTTQIPTDAVGGDDVLEPLKAILRGISVLPTEADVTRSGAAAAVTGTPDSVAIIEAGGTALSKGFASLIALLGGAGAVTAAVTGFWNGEKGGVRIALLAGTAFVLGAAAIAIAVIVSADVRGRAAGTVAQYNARSNLGTTLLGLSVGAHGVAMVRQAAASSSDKMILALVAAGAPAPVAHKASHDVGVLSGIRQVEGGATEVKLTRADGGTDWCVPSDLELREFTF